MPQEWTFVFTGFSKDNVTFLLRHLKIRLNLVIFLDKAIYIKGKAQVTRPCGTIIQQNQGRTEMGQVFQKNMILNSRLN